MAWLDWPLLRSLHCRLEQRISSVGVAQARVDHSLDRARRYLTPDLLIDDFGLHRLSAQQSSDLYELIIHGTVTAVSSSPTVA